jgi:hypothetical protein
MISSNKKGHSLVNVNEKITKDNIAGSSDSSRSSLESSSQKEFYGDIEKVKQYNQLT